ncbi:alpha/beta hydrolase [alpha proteobacterium AAP81b]|nr:alpha/beta hydrolase [alpha proteobacterium AAP81b]
MPNAEIAAIRAFLASMPADQSIAERRAGYDNIGAAFPTAADVTLTPVSAAGVPAEWSLTPGAAEDAALLYLHGGGYVIGSVASHRHLASELGRAAGIAALSLDYRLAPEHPFPAAVDDALAGYRWLLDQGIAAGRIAIAGDSAGGGLTMALLLAIKAAGLPQPACAVPISPWVDLAMTGGSMVSKAAVDPMVQRDSLLVFASRYLGAADPLAPLASPVHGDLAGLPPLLIQVGADETLLDDAVQLARAAGHAQVAVRLEIAPEMIHVWPFFHPMLAPARAAIATAGAFIAAHLA